MRAAMLSPRTLRTKAAGIEQSVLHVGQYLQKKGVNVEVYCTAAQPQPPSSFDGLFLREYSAIAPGENYFLSLPLYRDLASFGGEIIHCNGYNNLVSVAGVLAKKKNQKLIITMNSSGSSSALRRALHTPLLWFFQLFSSRLDKIICVSQWEMDYFYKNLPNARKRIMMIPNGIDVKTFSRTSGKKTPHMILSVGRLVKNKGHHRLIAALPYVLKEHADATLHIVGEGAEEEALKQQAHALGVSSHVIFHGNIPFSARSRLIELFSRAHVFALLTDHESQGIVFGEAAAAGLPMLLVDKGVMHEYVAHGVAAGLDEPDNPTMVARALVKLFQTKTKSKKNIDFIWSWERVGEAVYQVYQELAGGK